MAECDKFSHISDFMSALEIHKHIHYVLHVNFAGLSDTGFSTSLSDVWGFGVLMWEIFSSGQLPYTTMDNKHILKNIQQGTESLTSIFQEFVLAPFPDTS
jgi:hypothetical protein